MAHTHRSKNANQDWDDMSQASGLGTGTAFSKDVGVVGTLFMKDGQYNSEFLQTFITKPRNKGQPMRPIRQPTVYSEVPEGYQPRTVIYFKQNDMETDPQKREK